MIVGQKSSGSIFAPVFLGCVLTIVFTFLAMTVASMDIVPEFVRYILSPGLALGMAFASGRGMDYLGSFALITLAGNTFYYGAITFLLLRRINWTKPSRNWRHRFWMEP